MLGLSLLFKKTPVWRQYQEYELHPQYQSNWFGPNIQAVIESFESAGLDTTHLASRKDRATFKAEVRSELPKRLTSGTYEGLSPANTNWYSALPYGTI